MPRSARLRAGMRAHSRAALWNGLWLAGGRADERIRTQKGAGAEVRVLLHVRLEMFAPRLQAGHIARKPTELWEVTCLRFRKPWPPDAALASSARAAMGRCAPGKNLKSIITASTHRKNASAMRPHRVRGCSADDSGVDVDTPEPFPVTRKVTRDAEKSSDAAPAC